MGPANSNTALQDKPAIIIQWDHNNSSNCGAFDYNVQTQDVNEQFSNWRKMHSPFNGNFPTAVVTNLGKQNVVLEPKFTHTKLDSWYTDPEIEKIELEKFFRTTSNNLKLRLALVKELQVNSELNLSSKAKQKASSTISKIAAIEFEDFSLEFQDQDAINFNLKLDSETLLLITVPLSEFESLSDNVVFTLFEKGVYRLNNIKPIDEVISGALELVNQ